MARTTKKKQVVDYFLRNPDAVPREVGTRFKLAMPTVYALRKLARSKPTVKTEEVAPSRADDFQAGGDHYKMMGVEPWNVVDTWPRDQRIGYYRGCALKYIMRMGSKDQSAVEIAKGQHYIQKLYEVINSAAN